MRKIVGILLAVSVILSGCSYKNNTAYNAVKTTADQTTTTKPSSNSNQQSQSQPLNVAKDANSSTDSNDTNKIDTSKSLFMKGYYDYQGIIGKKMPIQMSIYPLGLDMAGSYFYESQRKEIRLKGKAGAKDIVLNEYDEIGKNTGIFKGTMKTVDKIEGTWTSADGKRSYPFTLCSISNLPGVAYGKRYEMATSKSDQEVENYVSKIQSYIMNDNKNQLAKEVIYPIKVKINNSVTILQNEEDFIRNYDKVFYPKYKQAMSNAFAKYMFANSKGIMFGSDSDNIWIIEIQPKDTPSKLMILGINN